MHHTRFLPLLITFLVIGVSAQAQQFNSADGTTRSGNGAAFRLYSTGGTLKFQCADNGSAGSGITWVDGPTLDTDCEMTGVSGGGGEVFAFRVDRNGSDWTAGSDTKVDWTHEAFDSNSAFNLSTDRFQPTEPGYYSLVFTVRAVDCAAGENPEIALIKNGASLLAEADQYVTTSGTFVIAITTLEYLNGSTDYVEAGSVDGGCTAFGGDAAESYFAGHRVGG